MEQKKVLYHRSEAQTNKPGGTGEQNFGSIKGFGVFHIVLTSCVRFRKEEVKRVTILLEAY